MSSVLHYCIIDVYIHLNSEPHRSDRRLEGGCWVSFDIAMSGLETRMRICACAAV